MTEPHATPRKRRTLEGIALILIAISAILFQRSATAPWAVARTTDSRVIDVSPIGLNEHVADTTRHCRWWPHVGNADMCAVAPGGEAAKSQLRRAYPLAVIALWSSVLALFLCALRVPRGAPWMGIGVAGSVPIVAAIAIWSLKSVTTAIASTAGSELDYAGVGFVSILGGGILMAIAVASLLFSNVNQRSGPRLD